MDLIENRSPKYVKYNSQFKKMPKKESKMCKKMKLGKTLNSANQHSNSANWHLWSVDWHFHSADWNKFQIEPRYVWFRSRSIRFNFLRIKPDPTCVY